MNRYVRDLKSGTGRWWTVVFVAALAGACSTPPPASEFRPTSTVREIMNSVIDPAADGLWDAVEVVATVEGKVEKRPQTDADWQALRRHAVALAEAGNLLLIPGRSVARPGEKAGDASVDLHPEEVEALILRNPSAWTDRAHRLHDAAMSALKAIDARNLDAYIEAGETLDEACESCHKSYWYRDPPTGQQ